MKQYRNHFTVISAMFIQLCMGGMYAWSMWALAIHKDTDMSMRSLQLVYGLNTFTLPIWMVVSSMFCRRFSFRAVTIFGGLLFGGGFIIASFFPASLPALIIGIGIFSGAGMGFCYMPPLTSALFLFPEKKGLVTGLVVSGFGAGAVVVSNLVEPFLNAGSSVFLLMGKTGIAYVSVIIICALIMKPVKNATEDVNTACTVQRISRMKEFLFLFGGMFSGTFAGFMIAGNLKAIAEWKGLHPGMAVMVISAFAIGNTFGRFAWGMIADFLHSRAVAASLALMFASVVTLLLIPGSGLYVLVCTAMIGFSLSANFVIYAVACSRVFGSKALTKVYPLVFFSISLSGLTGPICGGSLYDMEGGFRLALISAAFVSMIGCLICFAIDYKSCISCTPLSICELPDQSRT